MTHTLLQNKASLSVDFFNWHNNLLRNHLLLFNYSLHKLFMRQLSDEFYSVLTFKVFPA